jgi:hypothetical protein
LAGSPGGAAATPGTAVIVPVLALRHLTERPESMAYTMSLKVLLAAAAW